MRVDPVVLAGFAGYESCERAAAYAIGVAQRQAARVVFLHVWEPRTTPGIYPGVFAADREAVERTRGVLSAALAGLVGDSSVAWELRESVGTPLAQLVELAHTLPADVVVVGAGRRRRLSCARLATALIRQSSSPVIVVP